MTHFFIAKTGCLHKAEYFNVFVPQTCISLAAPLFVGLLNINTKKTKSPSP